MVSMVRRRLCSTAPATGGSGDRLRRRDARRARQLGGVPTILVGDNVVRAHDERYLRQLLNP